MQVNDFNTPGWPDRRDWLKSVAMLMGATAFVSSGAVPLFAAADERNGSGALHDRMMGFMLAHEQFSSAELLELGVVAESAGFDLLATSDHLQPWQTNEGHTGQAWVTMAALGQRTRRVWLGPTVTCPTFRYNPAVVAEGFASLSLLYPGRIFLGIGSGEALNEEAATGEWPNWQERSERFIEAAEIIRELWKGSQISHKGKFYSVNARLFDPPPKPIPLLMAANGPKAMRRAGQYGDGLITDPRTWKQHKSEFQAGAKAAGKDITRMPVLVEQYVVVGDEKDAQPAAELWRFGPKAFKAYYNIRDPQTIQERAEAEIPLNEVYADWPVSNDPAVHLKTVNDLFSSGVSIVNIHSGQADQKRVIDFYGQQVIPLVRRQKSAA